MLFNCGLSALSVANMAADCGDFPYMGFGSDQSGCLPAEASFYPQSQENGGAPCGCVLRNRESPPEHIQIISYTTGMDIYIVYVIIHIVLFIRRVLDGCLRIYSLEYPGVLYERTV